MRSAIAACTVAALATVFSVQQGAHGPLVVYKLQVPGEAEPAARLPAPQPKPVAEPTSESVYVIPSRAPSVLGTVVMPADSTPLLPAAAPPAQTPMSEPPLSIPIMPSAPMPSAPMPSAPMPSAPMPSAESYVSLQDVSDEVMWRRETVESLPQAPFAPRF